MHAKALHQKNTECCTEWALRVFHSWRNQWSTVGEKCPKDQLEYPTVELLNQWLPVFVIEARRENVERYPAVTINHLQQQQSQPEVYDELEWGDFDDIVDSLDLSLTFVEYVSLVTLLSFVVLPCCFEMSHHVLMW